MNFDDEQVDRNLGVFAKEDILDRVAMWWWEVSVSIYLFTCNFDLIAVFIKSYSKTLVV